MISCFSLALVTLQCGVLSVHGIVHSALLVGIILLTCYNIGGGMGEGVGCRGQLPPPPPM